MGILEKKGVSRNMRTPQEAEALEKEDNVRNEEVSINLIRSLSKLIHGVPFLPAKLQDTWLDRLWEKIEGHSRRTQRIFVKAV